MRNDVPGRWAARGLSQGELAAALLETKWFLPAFCVAVLTAQSIGGDARSGPTTPARTER